MRALVLDAVDQPLVIRDFPGQEPEQGQVVVSLKSAALNHRDFWITQGKYPGLRLPAILGSDGAGVIGDREVVINPGLYWGNDERSQSRRFRVLGMPDHGTFAQQIVISKNHVYDKPAHLSWEEAAALPLAGVTAYRALIVQGQAQPGETLVVSGIGGGVALASMQFALALGLKIFVTSGSDDKVERAVAMGASGGVNYRHDNWSDQLKEMTGGCDLVIDSAGGSGFTSLVRLIRPGGRLVTYGGSLGEVRGLTPQMIFWRQITIQGSTMGSQKDFVEMLAFVEKHEIRPVVDRVFDLAEGQEAIDYLAAGKQFGKVVLTIPQ